MLSQLTADQKIEWAQTAKPPGWTVVCKHKSANSGFALLTNWNEHIYSAYYLFLNSGIAISSLDYNYVWHPLVVMLCTCTLVSYFDNPKQEVLLFLIHSQDLSRGIVTAVLYDAILHGLHMEFSVSCFLA